MARRVYPIKSSGFNVLDDTNRTVAVATSAAEATEIAKLLNSRQCLLRKQKGKRSVACR